MDLFKKILTWIDPIKRIIKPIKHNLERTITLSMKQIITIILLWLCRCQKNIILYFYSIALCQKVDLHSVICKLFPYRRCGLHMTQHKKDERLPPVPLTILWVDKMGHVVQSQWIRGKEWHIYSLDMNKFLNSFFFSLFVSGTVLVPFCLAS